MRHTTLLLSSLIALQLSACQQEAHPPSTINQVSTQGDQAPAMVAQRDINVTNHNHYYGANAEEVKALQEKLQLSNAAIKPLLEVLDVENIPLNERTERFKALANKYKDLQQRLERYEKTDEFAQQAKQFLNNGQLDEAEKVLEQANEYERSLIKERQKNIAQRTFDLAEISELQLDYEEAIERYQAVTELTPNNLYAWESLAKLSERIGNSQQALNAWQQLKYHTQNQQQSREYNYALHNEANILAKQGNNNKALTNYEKAHQFFHEQAQRDPHNTDWQRDLSVSYERIGDLYQTKGERDKALHAFQAALNISKTLAQRDPHNTDWQRDLSVSYERIGDLYQTKGERDKALHAFQAALNISKTLAQRALHNTQWQSDLSVSYHKIGDLHQTKGDHDKALHAFQAALKINETLTQHDPDNTRWQRGLSVSYDRIGDLHQTKGDHDKALHAFQTSLNISKTLAQHDPNNTDWQRDLSANYQRIGDLNQTKGNHDKALHALQANLTITETLAQRDPHNAQWQRDLTVSYVKMSEIQTKQRKKWLQKALTIVETLHNNNRLVPTDLWMIDDLKQRLADE